MKRIFFASILFIAFSVSAHAAITEKVLKAFHSTFQNAKEVKWHEYESNFQVNFKHNDITTTVTYDKEGNILEARRYSKEDILPLIIREKLKRKYADKKVFGVTELVVNNQTVYRIVLEDNKKWTILDCDANGTLAVQNRFTKA